MGGLNNINTTPIGGIMSDVLQEMLDKARKAQAIVEHWPQDKVDEMVKAAAWEMIKPEHAKECAEMAVKETLREIEVQLKKRKAKFTKQNISS